MLGKNTTCFPWPSVDGFALQAFHAKGTSFRITCSCHPSSSSTERNASTNTLSILMSIHCPTFQTERLFYDRFLSLTLYRLQFPDMSTSHLLLVSKANEIPCTWQHINIDKPFRRLWRSLRQRWRWRRRATSRSIWRYTNVFLHRYCKFSVCTLDSKPYKYAQAKNIINYLRIIHRKLARGGVWINLGPLLWHWENNTTNDPSIELDLEELKRLCAKIGFVIEVGLSQQGLMLSSPCSFITEWAHDRNDVH